MALTPKNHDPDDVWSIRGYAWSLHVKARFIEQVKNDAEKARQILRDALRFRLDGERRFPDDIGVKEDVIKNLLSLLRLTPESQRQSSQDAVDLVRITGTPYLTTASETRAGPVERLHCLCEGTASGAGRKSGMVSPFLCGALRFKSRRVYTCRGRNRLDRH